MVVEIEVQWLRMQKVPSKWKTLDLLVLQ